MGQLVQGQWQRQPLVSTDAKGRFVRQPSGFNGQIRADGQAGPDGRTFLAEAGRYRLYVALACPWAHRALLARALMGLEDAIALDVVEPLMDEDGWAFAGRHTVPSPGSTHERLFGYERLSCLYVRADGQFTGRVTVPVLWDTQQHTIVSNDSASIMRMLASQFSAVATRDGALVPAAQLAAIEACNALVQREINQAVYKVGFAQQQGAYDEAVHALFAALARLDAKLKNQRFLCGERPTESDWRLFATLVRFDWVYATHFKCNLQRLSDFGALWPYARDLYQWPHVRQTVDKQQIKAHYYQSHRHLNPSGIVPAGFDVDFALPHQRG